MERLDKERRRRQILDAIIGEYAHSSEPVGSRSIARRFGVSPATIRNIMAELENDGYITHPHISAGRIPTDLGYRHYVDYSLKEEDLAAAEKEHMCEECFSRNYSLAKAVDHISRVLSELSGQASVTFCPEDNLFVYGSRNLLGYPEFHQWQNIRAIVEFLDNRDLIFEFMDDSVVSDLNVYIGHENHFDTLRNFSVVTSRCAAEDGVVGRLTVVGVLRMDYGRVIPLVRYASERLAEFVRGL